MAYWDVEWLATTDGGKRTIPAFDYLKGLPKGPREQLLAIVDAVRTVGPDQWKDEDTHKAMSPPVENLHEARDRHDQTLYRLYLLWQRDRQRVIILDGRTKPNNTALASSEYEALAALAATADDESALAVVDDFAREALDAE